MSKPQVTITLGRSGQVVKRPVPVSVDSSHSDYVSLSGNKRSIRDRLGNNGDKALSYAGQPHNKRQRGDGNRTSDDGTHVSRDDLRLKLMRKKEHNMDLREKLSRTALPPLRIDPRERVPDPKESGLLRRIPPTRSADDLLEMDSFRKSYSAWNLDGLRRRSPDRRILSTRGVSPPRNMDDRRQVRSADASRPTPIVSRDVLTVSRPASFLPKSTLPVESAKPVVRLPPPSAPGIVQKSSYMGEEPVTVAGLLNSLGLGKYAIMFQAEEVDMTALKQMGDNDLKELGIPMVFSVHDLFYGTKKEDSPCHCASFQTAAVINAAFNAYMALPLVRGSPSRNSGRPEALNQRPRRGFGNSFYSISTPFLSFAIFVIEMQKTRKRKHHCFTEHPTKNPKNVGLKTINEPYPTYTRPTPEECGLVRDKLMALHGFPEEFAKYGRIPDSGSSISLISSSSNPNQVKSEPLDGEEGDELCCTNSNSVETSKETVLDGLVSTLLSQNTTDANSRRAFASLKSAFPTWEDVLAAESKCIENAIKCGGLAPKKTSCIKNLLTGLLEKKGKLCLEYLRTMSIDDIKAELLGFKGIGPKTVACVLMFHLQLDDFPVDTHVFRITKAMGWVPASSDREKAYLHLNKRIPNELKFDLNCLFVTHGKLCQRCKRGEERRRPSHDQLCPLSIYCCSTDLK
ncbi:HhH-GPD domain [Macleaya cordata]|uniref:HhH-GPD domain n=1 Tax=Macleaya cordata TaxID=56857 RepID=A0A200R0K8_MACCD|nr:HhH-GPD domain [Macleaya cordata]